MTEMTPENLRNATPDNLRKLAQLIKMGQPLQPVAVSEALDLCASAWKTERERLEAAERQFPMQDGPSIPWPLAERIYFVYADLFGQQQSLEGLAKRGGFGWAEIPVFRKEYRAKHGWWPDWSATVESVLAHSPEEAK